MREGLNRGITIWLLFVYTLFMKRLLDGKLIKHVYMLPAVTCR